MKKYIQLALSFMVITCFSVFSIFSMNNDELIREKWKSDFYRIKTVKIAENAFNEEKPSDIEFDSTGDRILFTVKNSNNEKNIIGVYDTGTCIVEPEKIKNLDVSFQVPFRVKNNKINVIVKEVNYFIDGEHDKRDAMKWTWFGNNNHPVDASSRGNSFSWQKNKKSFSDRGIIAPEAHLISKSSKHFIECGGSTIVEDYKNALVVRDIESEENKCLALFSTDNNDVLCKLMKYSKSLLLAVSNNGNTICVYDTDKNELMFFNVSSRTNGFNIDKTQTKAFGNIYFE